MYVRGHSNTTWTRRDGKGVSGKSMVGHATKGRWYVKCSFLRRVGPNWVMWTTQLLNNTFKFANEYLNHKLLGNDLLFRLSRQF